jgi:hypothetical protein
MNSRFASTAAAQTQEVCSFTALPNKLSPSVRRPTVPLFPADVLYGREGDTNFEEIWLCSRQARHRNKALRLFGGFEALHLSFTSSKRPMRVFRSIVGAQSLLVQAREANCAKRGSVGPQFVGDDHRRRKGLMSGRFLD